MRRVTLIPNGSIADGRAISLPASSSLNDLLDRAGVKLGVDAVKLFTRSGGLVDDVDLVRDDDILFVSAGEAFEGRGREEGRLGRSEEETTRGTGEISSRRWSREGLSAEVRLPSDWITINVGGKCFTTTRSTLVRKEPDSMLAKMFAEDEAQDPLWKSSRDSTGAFLIDRSPVHFEPLLNFLRHGQLVLDKNVNPQGVLEEARFFGLTSLVDALEEAVRADSEPADDGPFRRRDVVRAIMVTSTVSELRFQGVNLTGIDLSRLDLRHVNFRLARLAGADLRGANLSHANLDRAELTKANLDGATLFGAKMVCASFEGASLKGCNFEDPAGSRTNMEGANLKGVNLEGSAMANVNLRVANLRNANLQNCDLRSAVLAGADLENCVLSGCDLQEANLRGANLTDVAFDLILTPLHCSQFNNISL